MLHTSGLELVGAFALSLITLATAWVLVCLIHDAGVAVIEHLRRRWQGSRR